MHLLSLLCFLTLSTLFSGASSVESSLYSLTREFSSLLGSQPPATPLNEFSLTSYPSPRQHACFDSYSLPSPSLGGIDFDDEDSFFAFFYGGTGRFVLPATAFGDLSDLWQIKWEHVAFSDDSTSTGSSGSSSGNGNGNVESSSSGTLRPVFRLLFGGGGDPEKRSLVNGTHVGFHGIFPPMSEYGTFRDDIFPPSLSKCGLSVVVQEEDLSHPKPMVDANVRVSLFGGSTQFPEVSSSEHHWNLVWEFDVLLLKWRVVWGNRTSFTSPVKPETYTNSFGERVIIPYAITGAPYWNLKFWNRTYVFGIRYGTNATDIVNEMIYFDWEREGENDRWFDVSGPIYDGLGFGNDIGGSLEGQLEWNRENIPMAGVEMVVWTVENELGKDNLTRLFLYGGRTLDGMVKVSFWEFSVGLQMWRRLTGLPGSFDPAAPFLECVDVLEPTDVMRNTFDEKTVVPPIYAAAAFVGDGIGSLFSRIVYSMTEVVDPDVFLYLYGGMMWSPIFGGDCRSGGLWVWSHQFRRWRLLSEGYNLLVEPDTTTVGARASGMIAFSRSSVELALQMDSSLTGTDEPFDRTAGVDYARRLDAYVMFGDGIMRGKPFSALPSMWEFTSFTCYGQNRFDPSVCSSSGDCLGLDTCVCDPSHQGRMCENLRTKCNGKYYDDAGVCGGKGICDIASSESEDESDVVDSSDSSYGRCSCLDDYFGVNCDEYIPNDAPPKERIDVDNGFTLIRYEVLTYLLPKAQQGTQQGIGILDSSENADFPPFDCFQHGLIVGPEKLIKLVHKEGIRLLCTWVRFTLHAKTEFLHITSFGEILKDEAAVSLEIRPITTSNTSTETVMVKIKEIEWWIALAGSMSGVAAVGGALVLLAIIFIIVVCCVVRRSDKKLGRLEEYEQNVGKTGLEMLIAETSDLDLAHLNIKQANFKIDYESLKIMHRIGEGGSNSIVFLGEWEGKEIAFKAYKLQDFSGDSGRERFQEFEREVNVLSSISHPHILACVVVFSFPVINLSSFYGATLKPPRVGIIMEYCSNGDLLDYCIVVQEKTSNPVPIAIRLRFLREISSAMSYMHKLNIIHRDLKLANILVTANIETKLTDFGLSRIVEGIDGEKKTTRAPEVVKGEGHYDKTCDMFSMGMIIFELVTNNFKPFGERSTGIELKIANDPNCRPSLNAEDLIGIEWIAPIIRRAWSESPGIRPTFHSLHRLFRSKLGVSDPGTLTPMTPMTPASSNGADVVVFPDLEDFEEKTIPTQDVNFVSTKTLAVPDDDIADSVELRQMIKKLQSKILRLEESVETLFESDDDSSD